MFCLRTAIDINDRGAKVWTKMEQEGKRVVIHVLCVCVCAREREYMHVCVMFWCEGVDKNGAGGQESGETCVLCVCDCVCMYV